MEESKARLKKCSTEALMGKLLQEGMDADVISKSGRDELVNWMLTVEGHDTGVTLPRKKTDVVDPMQMMMKLMMEMETARREENKRMLEMEKRREQEKLEENKRREQEKVEENQRREQEEVRWRAEMELKREELERAQQSHQDELDREHEYREEKGARLRERKQAEDEREIRKQQEQLKKSERLRKASKKLEKILPKMGMDGIEIPMYFKTVESYFAEFEVEDDLKIALLLPSLNEKARKVRTRLDPIQKEDYEEVKRQVLREFKMTPKTYRTQFMESVKGIAESWMQYASKLETIFKYYMEGRAVTTLEQLMQLMIADRMKDTMTFRLKEYILSKEAENWMTPRMLADAADIYISNVGEQPGGYKPRGFTGVQMERKDLAGNGNQRPEADKKSEGRVTTTNKVGGFPNQVYRKPGSEDWKLRFGNQKPGIKCFTCGGQHMRVDCPVKSIKRVQAVINHTVTNKENISMFTKNETDIKSANNSEKTADSSKHESLMLKVSVLGKSKSHEAVIKLQDVLIHCTVDSGADITVLNKNLLPTCFEQPTAKIRLKGAFGQIIDADVLTLPLKLVESEIDGKVEVATLITVAVTPQLDAGLDCLLTPMDYELLKERNQENKILSTEIMQEAKKEYRSVLEELFERGKIEDAKPEIIQRYVAKVSEVGNNESSTGIDSTLEQTANIQKLREEQEADETLEECFQAVKENSEKGKTFYLRSIDNLLFHTGQVVGRTVHQLVLPKNQRAEVMRIGHDIEWSGHLASEKTYQRIAVSFFWPRMKKEIYGYCKSCKSCQLRRRKTCWDRVPIQPVIRPEHAFEVMNFDIIGPFMNKSNGYAYVLTCICQCSRWPEAVPLRNLYAKTICEALLWIFTRTGIPKILVSDNASYNTAELTRELMKRLGVMPRFSTPYHPEGDGLIERYQAVIKSMIHHAVHAGHKDWHRLIPYGLWAYRETPNATTGVTPYEMVYGRPARGILSALKETWTGEQLFPMKLSEPTKKYLEKLKSDLEIAKSLAIENSSVNQSRYTDRYNLRSRAKSFKEGDPVIILMHDSTNKLCARWTGPAKIRRKLSPNSYDVEMDDGSVRRLHANHLRAYQERINAVGIIFDSDEDFGDLEYIPVKLDKKPGTVEEKFKELDLNYLDAEQRKDILMLLQKHKEVFSDDPGLCDPKIAEHVIKVKLKETDWPKQKRPYRIPPIYRSEVDRQIKELLEGDLIEEANSSIAHPVVCVLKPDGTVRLCIDNRYINSISVPDRFPMRQIDDILDRVGRAKYITALDATKGYWNISVEKESRPYTAFVANEHFFQWKRLNFGLRNAGATYQRAMEKILKQHSEYATAYIDDVSIYSMEWKEHLHHLDEVLRSIRESGLKLRLSKCKFAQKQIKLLGQIVGNGKRELDPQKVEAVRKIRPPTTKKEIQSFMGLLSFYRNFIPNLSEKALSLTELTKGKRANNIELNATQLKTFEELKATLSEAAVLTTPVFDGVTPFILQCDSSNHTVAACIAQEQPDGIERPIAFASAKLSKCQLNWSVIEKEGYSIIFGLRRFESYLIGSPIIIFTDHNPLKYIVECSPKSARLTRWSLALTKFDIVDVRHKRWVDNSNVDALTRLITSDNDDDPSAETTGSTDPSEVRQKRDSRILQPDLVGSGATVVSTTSVIQ